MIQFYSIVCVVLYLDFKAGVVTRIHSALHLNCGCTVPCSAALFCDQNWGAANFPQLHVWYTMKRGLGSPGLENQKNASIHWLICPTIIHWSLLVVLLIYCVSIDLSESGAPQHPVFDHHFPCQTCNFADTPIWKLWSYPIAWILVSGPHPSVHVNLGLGPTFLNVTLKPGTSGIGWGKNNYTNTSISEREMNMYSLLHWNTCAWRHGAKQKTVIDACVATSYLHWTSDGTGAQWLDIPRGEW
jgi:hypothetical protein